MTAYIKMIDTWMIFTMFYPFSVVILYSVLQFLNTRNQNIPISMMKSEENGGKIRKITGIVNFLLDHGLPIIVLIFIMIFWILGINHTSSEFNKSCWNFVLLNGCCVWYKTMMLRLSLVKSNSVIAQIWYLTKIVNKQNICAEVVWVTQSNICILRPQTGS